MLRIMFPAAGLRLPGQGRLGREHLHRRQTYDRHRAVVAIPTDGLFDTLPTFCEEHERLRCDSDVLIDRFVAECPEIFPRCRFNPLREEEVREVYYVTIRELSRSSLQNMGLDITRVWLRRLERLIEVDRSDARIASEAFVHRRSNHLFRALAEVSFANRSLRIGQVLHIFFVRHASQIVSTETSATIGQWCNAVLRAHMMEAQRAECLRHVHRLRPDLPQSLRRYGHRGQLVAEHMERFSVGAVAERRGIRFGRPALNYRSRSAGLLAGDGGLLGLGNDIRHGRHGLMAAGRFGNDLEELDHDSLCGLVPDRCVQQNGLEEQRLLELSMGPRFGSRLDGLGLLTLEDDVDDVFVELGSDLGHDYNDDLDLYGI